MDIVSRQLQGIGTAADCTDHNLPACRSAGVLVEGKLGTALLFGGKSIEYNGRVDYNDIWSYSMTEAGRGKWLRVSESMCSSIVGPSCRAHHTGVRMDDAIVVFGGDAQSSETDTVAWIYKITDGTWRRGPTSDTGGSSLWGHTAVTDGRRMYVWGGVLVRSSGVFLTNSMRIYDFYSDTWITDTTIAASMGSVKGPCVTQHSAVMWSGGMYVYGGFKESSISEDLHVYTIATGVWKQLPSASISLPRSLHSAIVHSGSSVMSIFGGISGVGMAEDRWRIDLAGPYLWVQDTPFACGPQSSEVQGCAMSQMTTDIRDALLVYGGETIDPGINSYRGDLWAYRRVPFLQEPDSVYTGSAGGGTVVTFYGSNWGDDVKRHAHTHTYTRRHTHKYTHTYACIQTYAHTHTHTHTHKNMNTHTQKHEHTNTHTHTITH
jgi:hypothetical protein